MAEIDAFLQQVLADQRKWEADPTPQTPAHALLAAGRPEEAEALAREAVSDPEKESTGLEIETSVLQLENVAATIERAARGTDFTV